MNWATIVMTGNMQGARRLRIDMAQQSPWLGRRRPTMQRSPPLFVHTLPARRRNVSSIFICPTAELGGYRDVVRDGERPETWPLKVTSTVFDRDADMCGIDAGIELELSSSTRLCKSTSSSVRVIEFLLASVGSIFEKQVKRRHATATVSYCR